MNQKILISCFSFLIAGTISAEVVSAPVGFLRVTFPSSKTGSLSIPLLKNPIAVGPITAVGASTLTDSNASWTSGQFSSAAKPYFLKMVTGSGSGRYFLITGNTSHQLSVDTRAADLTKIVTVGNRYQIIPACTLGQLFGTSSVPFLTHTDPTFADNLKLWGGTGWEVYYHNGTSWMRKGRTGSYNDAVIYPDEGVQVVRRGTTPLTLSFAGEASVIPEKTQVIGPATTFAANRYPVNVTLKNLGLLTLPNWLSGATPSEADRVQINENGNWVTYWHNGISWRRGGNTLSQDNTPINAGTGYLILRKSSSVGISDIAAQLPP